MRINNLVLLISSLVFTSAIAAEDKAEVNGSAVEQTATNVCAACHGADGNSAIAMNPKLAGQHSDYLYKQLKNFKEGDRANAIMALQAQSLSDKDMRALAVYYASHKPNLAKAKTNGEGSLGERIYRGGISETKVPACAACHGANGEGIPKIFPRLSAQHSAYTLKQLKTFRTGDRANGPMMQSIAAKMTEAEMEAVADYIQGLR